MKLSDDPYALGKVILPELVTTMEEQRELRQASSPYGNNDDFDKKAYRSFRHSDREDKTLRLFNLRHC